MRDQLLVSFAGPGAGVGPLAWGQKGIWQTTQENGRSVTMGAVAPLAAGKTVQDVAAVLRYSVSRHESLRTRLRFAEDGTVLQEVSESGVIPLEIVDAGAEDPHEVAERVHQEYTSRDFDYAAEWPLRFAVISSHGALTHVVAVYLHLYIDALGLQVLLSDLAARDPATGEAAGAVTAMQPLEQARWQQTPAAQRQCEASLRHLERVLRTVPAQRFAGPVTDEQPSYSSLRFSSPATRLAVRLISQRLSMDSSPVLLGLFAVALTRLTGSNPFLTMLAVSNRFRPGLAGTVSAVAQVSPCMIDLADLSLDEAMGRARRAAVGAQKNAYYDPPRRMALIARINAERGEKVDTSCFFNDRRRQRDLSGLALPSAEQLRQATAASRHSWLSRVDPVTEKLYLSVDDLDEAIVFELSADTRYLPPQRMQALLDGIEAVAVEAALDPSQLAVPLAGRAT